MLFGQSCLHTEGQILAFFKYRSLSLTSGTQCFINLTVSGWRQLHLTFRVSLSGAVVTQSIR